MPVDVKYSLQRISQREFGDIAYAVMDHAFEIHKELGRLLSERTYQGALRRRLGRRAEVGLPVRVWHRDFEKRYVLDLVVDQAAVFELKTTEWLTDGHRSQLMNYLMLTDTDHGKLINFRPTTVEHEFVNSLATPETRHDFARTERDWDPRPSGSRQFEQILIELLRDWGTGLSLSLYEEALVHFLGGEDRVVRNVDIVIDGATCGHEKVGLLGPANAYQFSCVGEDDYPLLETHLRRFLRHSSLSHIQWANITVGQLTLKTLSKT